MVNTKEKKEIKMMLRVFIYSIFSTLLFSCQGQENKIEFEKKIQEGFKKSLYDIGVKIQDTVYVKDKTLYFNMVKDSGYYVDETTGHLLRSYLLFKYYDNMKELDSVNIHVEYKDLADKTTYHFPRHGIDKIYTKLSGNTLFMDLLPHIIRDTDANDIIYMDNLINETPEYVSSEKFTFKGKGFWEFIYEYTLNCCNIKSDMHMNMDEILHSSKYPDFPVRPDIFEYVIKESEKYCIENKN